MNINQEFKVEITRADGEGDLTLLYPNLANAILSWEREFNEEEEDEDSEDDHGFLLPKDQLGEDSEDEDEEEGEEEGPEEEAVSDSTLYATLTLNKEVLRELNEIETESSMLNVSFVYGDEQVGTIRREFTVGTDPIVSFGSGTQGPEDLTVGLMFDVYDSSIVY